MIAAVLAATLLLPGPAPPSDDGEKLEIFTLNYRTAEDVLPTLLPIVEGHGAITGSGSQIFVRAAPAVIAQVKDVLGAMDVRPRNLWITVRQVFQRRGTRGVEPGFRGFEEGVQKVRALEGHESMIEIRRDVPRRERGAVLTPGGMAVVDDTWFEMLGSGFGVIPRLTRDGFTVEIATHLAPEIAGPHREHELRTTVSGQLGEWTEIGRVLEEYALRLGRGFAGPAATQRTQNSVLVKVEALD
jgi:hypothetical protein